MKPATAAARIRILRAAILALVSALFAHAYGAFTFNRYGFVGGLRESALPLPCHFFLRYAALGYLLPAAALVLGLWVLKRKGADSSLLELVLSSSYVCGALWAAACVLAWFLPGYVPDAVIR